ncbi:MAG: bifunctional 4-hydroxy-2-oxoglutarate aldolase/2-dehydro-3-deoxy-phosphogluconate aldolase, partial [Bacteroidales bacterium]|nr:bifunctional 4-hydroxy-2-oxoglutarate aldolase/2-dehydro-3-deoxy-phosphogluconate aldolase [Bacteroidales bacterium]
MAKFRKLETLTAIKDSGIVPVFFNGNLEIAKNVVKACYAGGIRAFEFTNRGDFAIMIFRDLSLWALKECPEMIL